MRALSTQLAGSDQRRAWSAHCFNVQALREDDKEKRSRHGRVQGLSACCLARERKQVTTGDARARRREQAACGKKGQQAWAYSAPGNWLAAAGLAAWVAGLWPRPRLGPFRQKIKTKRNGP